jgi:hypothetical protein
MIPSYPNLFLKFVQKIKLVFMLVKCIIFYIIPKLKDYYRFFRIFILKSASKELYTLKITWSRFKY